MARIAGINLPTNKRVIIALTYIHGIGNTASREICKSVGIEESKRINEISDSEVMQIREHIDANMMVEGDLRREKSMNIKSTLKIKLNGLIFPLIKIQKKKLTKKKMSFIEECMF